MTSIATRFNKFRKTTKNSRHAHGQRFNAVLETLEPRKLLASAPVGGSIIFVDHDVIDAQAALGALPGAEVVFLRHDRSGFDQVSEVLAQRRGLESIQFVSHGSSGQVGLGASKLDALTLHDLAGTVAGWGDALAENGDIALWGCDVASDAAGRAFVRDLASVSRADVAASMNRTGSTSLGADWVLEFRIGAIEQKLTSPFMPNYRYVLGGNHAPIIGGATGFQGVTDVSTVNPFTGVTIDDIDNDTLSISVALDNAAKGVFTPASLTASGFVHAGGGVYTFTGAPAAASTAIGLLVFDPTDNRVAPNNTETTTFTISADDGIAAPVTDSDTSVFSVSVNDAPTITGVSTFVAVADTSTVRPFPSVVLGDVDSPAQTLTVSVTLDSAAKGVFTPGSLAASGFVDAGGGVYTFSGTGAAATAAINQLYYDPTNNRVAPGTTEITTFTISVDDGDAAAVTNNGSRVYAVSVNDAPTIGGTSAGQAVNDNATVALFSAVTLADVDSPAQTQTITVTLDTAAKGVFSAGSLAASGFVDAGGGVYTFSGTAAASQVAIRQLVFDPTNNRVAVGATETTTFTISIFDGLATPSTDTSTTVVSTSMNDAPTIGGASAGQAVNETSTITPFSTVTVADVDNPAQTMTVSVTLDDAAKGVFTAGSLTASGFVSAGGGVYTFSGTAAATQTAIRLLAFDPTDNRVDTGMTETTTFTISVDDGIAAATTDSTTTAVSTAINEAPTIGGVSAGQAVNDTGTITPFSAVTIADPDTVAQTQTVSVTLDAAAKGIFTVGSLAASGFNDDGGGVYSFSGTAAQAQTAIRLLAFDPTDNRVAVGSTETTTFTISVDDGVAAASTNSTTTAVSTSTNDAPTVGGTSAGQAVNDNATVLPFSAVTIADVDPSQTQTVTVTLDTAAKGTFTAGSLAASGFSDDGGGVFSFSGTADAAQTAIRLLAYDPTNDRVAPGMTETTTFTISVNDGVAAAATDSTTTAISTSINDAPAIGGVSAGQAVNDNATITPFSATTIADPDSPAQTMTVSVTLDTAAKGVFTVGSLTASGFVDAGAGVYTFSGTAAATQTAIRQLVFDPANNRVTPGSTETTMFTISVDDGVAVASTDSTTTVESTSMNDAPTIGGVSAGQAVNDNATVTLFSAVTVADVDSPAQTMTVSVTLDTAAKGIFTAGSLAASGFVDAGGGVYTFSGTAAATQTAIRQLIFNPTNDRVTVGSSETTTFTISVNDGIASAVTDNTTTVVSTSMNDAPTIDGAIASQAVNDTATVLPFSALTVADVDPSQTQTVSVTLDNAAKGVFTAGSLAASGFVDAGGGVYTFSGTAAATQTAIRQLVFNPADNRTTPGATETTTFTVSVDDGVAAPATDNTTTVVSTSMNDAPTIGGASAGQAVNDNATVEPFSAITFADVDSPAQTQTVSVTLDTAAKGIFTAGSLAASGFVDAGGGMYTFSGTAAASQTAIRQLVFNPANDRVAPGATETTTFTISVDDGVASPVTNNTASVVSTSVNDAPTIGGVSAGQAVNETSTVTVFSAVTIADTDNPAQTMTVSVTLDTAAKGVFTAGSLAASGFIDAGGGVYTFSGTAVATQTAIRQLAFDPTDNRVDTGVTETTTFTISVNDGIAAAATNSTTTAVSTAVNEAPTIGGVSAGQTVTDITTLLPFSAVTIADPDTAAQTQTVSVTLDTAAKGVFTAGSLAASGFVDAGGGVYTFSGTAAASQVAIRQLVFNPADNRVAQGSTETTTFTVSVDDGVAAAATDSTTTVVSSGVNDAPTIGGVSAGQAVNDNATVTLFSAVTIADVDPGQTQSVAVVLDTAAKGVFTLGSLAASGFVDMGGGVYTFSGTAAASQTAIRQLVFNPTNDRVAPGSTETTTFTIVVNDSIANPTIDSTTTVVSTSMNDAPTIGGVSAGQAVNDNSTVSVFSATTIADTDNPAQTMTVSVTLDTAAKGIFTPGSLTASGFVDAGGGVYTFSGTAADTQTAIRLLAFDPTNNRVAVGMTETTTFTISVNDGIAAAATDNTTTAVSTSVNDAPTIGGVSAGQTVNDNATITPFSSTTITDADSPAQTLSISVTLDTAAKGVFTAGSLAASGFVDAGGGVYTFSGTAAASQTAIRQLIYNPTDNRVTPGTTETTTFTISADDGVASAVTDSTSTVVSTSVNDATSIGGASAGQATNDTANVTLFSAITFADIDSPAQIQTFTVTLDTAAKGVFTAGSLAASGFTDAGGGNYTFVGTVSEAQTAIRQLIFDPTNNRVAPASTETTTFTISADDGISSAVNDSTTTVVSTSVNDAPTIGGAIASQAVNDIATLTPFATITVTDPDFPAQTQTVSITLDTAAKGVFTVGSLAAAGFTDAGGGVYTFTGTAANAQSGMRQLVFNPADNRVDTGMTETTTFTISVDDGIAVAASDSTTTVVSTSVNDAPTIGGVSAGQAVNDSSTITLFSTVTVADPDSPTQTMTVSVTLDDAAKGIFTAGSLAASGFVDAGGGVYTFSGTAAATQTAIRQLIFNPTDNRVVPTTTETTTFTISVDDGVASAVTDNTTTVVSTSMNDAPTIGGTSAGQTTNDNANNSPFSAVTISDVDTAQTLSISVTLDTAAKGVFTAASLTASGFVDAGAGVYTFSGTAAAAQTAIRLLDFDASDNRVTPGATETTTFTISVDDTIAAPATDSTTTVISTSVNDAPTIGGVIAGQAVNDSSTVSPFSAVTIGDVDNPAQSMTVSVTIDTAAKGVFTAGSLAASGFADAGAGVYTFTGTAADTQTAIRQLIFNPTDNRVAPTTTETSTFTISVYDGMAAATTDNTTTVVSTSMNDAPTIGGTSAGQAVNDNATVSPFSAVTFADVDSPAQTMSVSVTIDDAAKGVFTAGSLAASGFVDAGGGVYTFSGTAAASQTAIRQLVFNPTNDRVLPTVTETSTFTIDVSDGITTPSDASTTVVSTSMNDAPTIGGTSAGQAVNDNSTITPFAAATISDADASQSLDIIVSLDDAAKGVFTPASLIASGFVHAGSGVYTFTGNAADAQAAIRQLVFDPTENAVAVGMTETTTFAVLVDDGIAAPAADTTTTVVSTSVNVAPTIGGVSAGQTVNDDSTVSPFTAVTIADADSPADSLFVIVTLDTATKGVFTHASLIASGFVDITGGQYAFVGNASDSQAAIRLLAFDPANDRGAVGTTETTTFTISVDDSVAAPSTNSTTTVVLTSMNDAPTLDGASAGQAVNDTATLTPFGAFTISDPDPSQSIGVSVTLDTAAKGAFTAGSLTMSGFVDAGGGVYTFSGTASAAQTAIRLLAFDPANDRAAVGSTETTTFTVIVNDGVATDTTDSITTVVSTSMNDAPTIGGAIAGQAVNDDATVSPFTGMTISDVDPSQSLIVSVALDSDAKGVFTPASLTASGFTDAGSGVYLFSGTAAAAQAAIRLLAFDPTNNRGAVGSTETSTFTITVDDSIATPPSDSTTTVVSTSANDAPTIGGIASGQAVNDNATVSPFTAVTFADVDSPAQTQLVTISLDNPAKGAFTAGSLTASGFVDAGGGTYTFSGTASASQAAIHQLVYQPTANRVAVGTTETTTFAVTINDTITFAANTSTTVVSTSINNAPTVGGEVAGQAVIDITTVLPFTTFTISDVDPSQTMSISVTVDAVAKGFFTAASLSASGFVSAGSGVYTFSGTAAAAQAAIRLLNFDPTNYRVAPGATETTTFTISVNDGVASPITSNSTTVISTGTNATPTLTGISTLTGATARSTHTISYASLFAASNAADANTGDTIRFRVESLLNGTLTKNGVAVTTGVTTLASGENLVWTSAAGASGTTGAFTVRAFDGTAASAAAITVNVGVTAIAVATSAVDSSVDVSSNSSGLVTIVTHNDAGQTILLQQTSANGSWVRINLTSAGVPTVTGGTVTFVDPATGMTHAAVVTASGLYLLSDTGTGVWISRNLTTEISGAPTIVGELVTFTTTDGLNVIAGRTAGGDVVIYNQTGAVNGQGRGVWTATNIYDQLRNQSEPTPAFTTPLSSYVTSWNGLNIAGLDSSGNIWTIWTGGGLAGWHSSNLSTITGAPALSGGVTAYTTSWGGINLAGVDVNGDLSVTWWVPSFGGAWSNVNFTSIFGGPDLLAGSLTSYVTSWNALNIAGLDTNGNVVQYWWVPPSSPNQDFWCVTPLTSSMSNSLRRPNEGKLTGLATADSRLNLIGSNNDGHIVRLWWSPTHDWSLEDLTVLVS